jgi:hypothetical protein
MYGFIPNAPGQMRCPPPRDKQPRTEQDLANALPRGKNAAEQIATAHLLSLPTESPLGYYHPAFFAGSPEILAMVKTFEKELDTVSAEIAARNQLAEVSYNYLDPTMLYPSVEI